METEKREFTVDAEGNLKLTDGGKETIVTPELLDTLKRQAKQKIKVTLAVEMARKQVKEAKDGIELEIAKENLKKSEEKLAEMKEKWNEEIENLNNHISEAELARKTDNGILSPIVAFFEGYCKTKDKIKTIMSNEELMELDDKFLEGLKNSSGDESSMKAFLDESGVQWESVQLSKENQQEVPSDTFVLIGKKDDGTQRIKVLKADNAKERISNPQTADKFKDCVGISVYQVRKEELMGLMTDTDIMDESSKKDKCSVIESLPSSLKVHEETLSKEEGERMELKPDIIEEYNRAQRNRLSRLYKKEVHTIDPESTDFTKLGKMGIDLRDFDDETCESLLYGNLSPLTKGYEKKNGKMYEMQVKFRLTTDYKGKGKCVIHPALTERVVPDKLFGKELDEEQKRQLKEKGCLDRCIEISANGKIMTVMPYFDNETNQLLCRDYSSISLPKEINGKELNERESRSLLGGETVRMENLTDNAGQQYNGYVRINPKNGKIITVKEPDIQHQYQVAANNNGARTEDLKNDKDTFLKSGQTHNDDLVENKTPSRNQQKKGTHKI